MIKSVKRYATGARKRRLAGIRICPIAFFTGEYGRTGVGMDPIRLAIRPVAINDWRFLFCADRLPPLLRFID